MDQKNPFSGLFQKLDSIVDFIHAGIMLIGGSVMILAIAYFGLRFATASDPHEKSNAKSWIKNILIGGAILAGSSTLGKALFEFFKD